LGLWYIIILHQLPDGGANMNGELVYFKSIWDQVLNQVKSSNLYEQLIFDSFVANSKLHEIYDGLAIVAIEDTVSKAVIEEKIEQFNDVLSDILKTPHRISLANTRDLKQSGTVNVVSEKKSSIKTMQLNIEQTFDSYIQGESNLEARQAALAVSYSPGRFYNPLFIYGQTGLGKTHLLNAIGNYIASNKPDKKILYMTSNDFIEGCVNAFRSGGSGIDEFKRSISEVDVFLVDDIQFLAGKEKSNEVFFHVFNDLIASRKQIVLTSDCPPNEIKNLENRMISRFAMGLTIGVSAPEFETAVQILKSKIYRLNEADFDNDVIEYLAANYRQDVRRLEGVLRNIMFSLITRNGKKVDLKFVQSILDDAPNQSVSITVGVIKRCVNNFYGLSKGQLESKLRTKNVAIPRHIAMYLCRKHMDMPFKTIGENFGNKDHSTVMNACSKIEKLLKQNDKAFIATISKIEECFEANHK